MNDEEAFESLLVSEITAVRQAGESTFSGLLRTLAGPDPPTLLAVLQRMAALYPWTNDLIGQALGTTADDATTAVESEPSMPVNFGTAPHPLDFDWRFIRETVADLETFYVSLAPPSGTVLFLGTPSLFQATRRQSSHSSITRVLIDKNVLPADGSEAREILMAIQLDICRDPLPENLLADVILTDPPWYENELRAFLWAAAVLCRSGGTVAACLPGLTTRPGMTTERARMMDWAREALGLACLAVYPKRVRYQTPPFEHNTWRTAGIRGISSDWRAGDVALFRKELAGDLTSIRPDGPWEQPWCSLQLGDVLLRLRPDSQTGFADPTLIRLFPDDVLPSVSRRDVRRKQIDVWSGGNRVFACHGRAILECIGRALAADSPTALAVEDHLGRSLGPEEKNLVERAVTQLLTLMECERYAGPSPLIEK